MQVQGAGVEEVAGRIILVFTRHAAPLGRGVRRVVAAEHRVPEPAGHGRVGERMRNRAILAGPSREVRDEVVRPAEMPGPEKSGDAREGPRIAGVAV